MPSFRKKRRQPAAHQNHRYGRQYTIHRNGHRSAARRRRPRGFPPMGTDAPPEIRMAANRTTRNIRPCRHFVRHGCLGNISYSKPQTKNFRKRLSAYRNSPLAENRGTAGQRTGRSAPGEIYDAVRLPAINRKQGPVQMNRPLPQQYATAAYFRCGFRLRHSSTGGMIPIEITSSRSLQRCP